MPPAKKRSIPSRSPGRSAEAPCPCTSCERNTGICDLDVWQGTTLDDEAARSGRRLLRANLPVIKSKHWTQLRSPARLYHLVCIGWIPLLCVFVGVYVGVVGVFALLFAACRGLQDNLWGPRNYFNLSLQTLSSTGYGDLFPANTCSRWIGVMESFSSMLITSFMTGVAFVKFARPHPNIAFSNVFTVSRGEKDLEMRFRVANEAHRDLASKGDIIDVGFKLILMRIETGRHGEKRLCYYDLKLKTARLISLRLELELVHTINTNSPFFNQTLEDLERSDFVLILLASGVDENLHDVVHKKQEYDREAMRWSATFLPMLEWDNHHKFIELDLDKISTVAPLTTDCTNGHAIDMDITNSPVHEHDSPSSSDNESNGEPVGNSGNPNSQDFHDEDAIPHKLADGSGWELSDDYDKEAIIRRTDEYYQEGEKGSDERSTSDSDEQKGGRATQTRSTQRRRSSSYQEHDHDLSGNAKEQPMSLLQRRVRIRNRSRRFLLNGIYQRALVASWPSLLLCLVASYLAVVATIALLISISIHEPLAQRTRSSFARKYEEVFFFCVQTISTVGYGTLSPRQDSDAANFFVFLLVFSGLFVSTLVTGITWAKFSIPKASTLLFSDVLLITTFHSHRAVMFRAANNRKFGVLVDGSFRMSVVVLKRNFGRRETHELRLVRNVWPIVNLCNTLTHIIDESSPLYHLSTKDLLSGDHFFVVLFTGQDNVISDTMVARKSYHACDILVDHHFEDNITLTPDGLYIDLDAINATYCDADVINQSEEEQADAGSSPRSAEAAANGSPRFNYELLGE